jgi:L-alanine-DL-glutamate epimerase-like enolase superfamily enzyme
VIEDGYRFRDGHWTVSDAPGLGIRLDAKVYDKKYRANETVLA